MAVGYGRRTLQSKVPVAASKAFTTASKFTTKTLPESYAALAKPNVPSTFADQSVVPVRASSAISVSIPLGPLVVVVTNTRPSAIKGYEIKRTPLALKLRLHFTVNGGTNGLAGSEPS